MLCFVGEGDQKKLTNNPPIDFSNVVVARVSDILLAFHEDLLLIHLVVLRHRNKSERLQGATRLVRGKSASERVSEREGFQGFLEVFRGFQEIFRDFSEALSEAEFLLSGSQSSRP